MKKNLKGFTLIELIVVIAIIGILAGILIPVMSNYNAKARMKSFNADAKTVFNYFAANATSESGITDGLYYYGDSVSGATSSDEVNDIIEASSDETIKDLCVCVKIESGKASNVIVSNNATDFIYGAYPNAINEKPAIDYSQYISDNL